MKPFLWAMIVCLMISAVVLWFDPATWFYHGMTCSGSIGGGCDTSTATGGIFKWMGK